MDWPGRAVIEGKRGSMPENLPPILERLKIEPSALLRYLSRKDRFHKDIGSKTSIRETAIKLRKCFLQGIAAAERLFPQRI